MISVRRPSPAMVVALVALFVALGGSVYAASKFSGTKIKKGSEPGNRLKNDSVTGKQVKESSLAAVPNASHATNSDQLGGSPASAFVKGPGPTTFSTTLAQGTTGGTIATLANGLKVTGTCTNGPANVLVDVRTISGSFSEQASGTATNAAGVFRADVDGTNTIGTVQDTSQVDLDVIARDTNVGNFDRIDVHGAFGLPCKFWGMIIPSS